MNQKETLALWQQGKDAWNAWAERMLAKRRALEEKGQFDGEIRSKVQMKIPIRLNNPLLEGGGLTRSRL